MATNHQLTYSYGTKGMRRALTLTMTNTPDIDKLITMLSLHNIRHALLRPNLRTVQDKHQLSLPSPNNDPINNFGFRGLWALSLDRTNTQEL